MESRGGRVSVIAAIAANVAIAFAKFVVAAVTGSSTMLSEAIHSVVDTGDGVLLWIGLRRSRRPADLRHPFGPRAPRDRRRPRHREGAARGRGVAAAADAVGRIEQTLRRSHPDLKYIFVEGRALEHAPASSGTGAVP